MTDSGESIAVTKFVDESTVLEVMTTIQVFQHAQLKTMLMSQLATKDALSELSGDRDDVTEGTTNLYFTAPRARGNISVTDAGGDGSY